MLATRTGEHLERERRPLRPHQTVQHIPEEGPRIDTLSGRHSRHPSTIPDKAGGRAAGQISRAPGMPRDLHAVPALAMIRDRMMKLLCSLALVPFTTR